MLSQRRPFEVLNENKPAAFKRVQPSRAAKTSHKWLSARNERQKDGEEHKNIKASYDGLGCSCLDAEYDKENLSEECIGVPSKSQATYQPQSYKSKSEQPGSKDQSHRIPLQTLSVPSIKPYYRQRDFLQNTSENPHGGVFFPPIERSPEVEDHDELSVTMETISENSLACDPQDDENKHTDSAFFSCTQSSANSQNETVEEESQDTYVTRVNVRRPLIRADDEIDVVNEYFSDIIAYMRQAEQKYRPSIGFMRRQPEISSNMRTKLVDWLIEVQDEYKLENETVALAVTYVDRFLSQMSVTRAKLQLLGTTAMFVAAKYEEIYPPDADEFAYVTADTYTTGEVILMERLLLKVLGTSLAVPTPNQFLGFLFHRSHTTVQFRTLTGYLAEITMLYDEFHTYLYSVLAASAIAVASYITHCFLLPPNGRHDGLPKFTKDLSKFTPCMLCTDVLQYMRDYHEEIYNCSLDLLVRHKNLPTTPQQFVREKYSSKKYHKVALVQSTSLHGGVIDTTARNVSRDSLLAIWLL